MNCGEEISSNEACFFSRVMVCSDCNIIAKRMLQRGIQTVDMLRKLLRLSIQQAIVNKKLQFHARHLEEGPEVDFLGELMKMVEEVRMAELQEEQGCPSSTSANSMETTKLSVSIAVGPPSSDSPSGSTTK